MKTGALVLLIDRKKFVAVETQMGFRCYLNRTTSFTNTSSPIRIRPIAESSLT